MSKRVYTTFDIAKHCQVDITTVINWTEDGSLKSYKTKGGHRRIQKSDLYEFLNKHNMPNLLTKKILIVDDDESITSALKEFFEKNDFIVYTADDGFKAGIIFEAERPEIVILDLVMPYMNGFQVCEHIRNIEKNKRTRIIILTGYYSSENIKKAKMSGADKCLPKPAESKVILREIIT